MAREQAKRYPRTKKEREFRLHYWNHTGIEFSDDTTVPFLQRAQNQLQWFLDHAIDAHNRLEHELMALEQKESR